MPPILPHHLPSQLPPPRVLLLDDTIALVSHRFFGLAIGRIGHAAAPPPALRICTPPPDDILPPCPDAGASSTASDASRLRADAMILLL